MPESFAQDFYCQNALFFHQLCQNMETDFSEIYLNCTFFKFKLFVWSGVLSQGFKSPLISGLLLHCHTLVTSILIIPRTPILRRWTIWVPTGLPTGPTVGEHQVQETSLHCLEWILQHQKGKSPTSLQVIEQDWRDF